MAENEHMHENGEVHQGEHHDQAAPVTPMTGDAKDVEENKMIAALGYVWVLALVPFLAKKDSKFAQFHAKQGMVLFIVEVISAIIGYIPIVGLIWIPFGLILGLVLLVFSIMGIINAYQGQMKELPVVGSLAKQLFK